MNWIESLGNTRALWISFIATVLCTVAFQVIAGRYDLVLIDALFDPEEARAAIAAMSASQRAVHAWVTGTLDVLYPLVYGALFAGSAYCFFRKAGVWLAAPIFLLVPVDLAEGVVQILGLTGQADWLDAKLILTTTKYVLFCYGLFLTVCGWIFWLIVRIRAAV